MPKFLWRLFATFVWIHVHVKGVDCGEVCGLSTETESRPGSFEPVTFPRSDGGD